MEYTKDGQEHRRRMVMLRSHVERCLQEVWGAEHVVEDADGDYPFRHGTAAGWVTLLDGAEPGVLVFAHAAYGLRPSARLAREVNELNDHAQSVKVALRGGLVSVSALLHWSAVDRLALELAVRQVAWVADDIGVWLASVYAGHTPFPAEGIQQDQVAHRVAGDEVA